MGHVEPTFIDLLLDAHINLKRQGPGSIDITKKALSFIDGLDRSSKIADLGCGTGGGTADIAKFVPCAITGLDLFPQFIDVLEKNMRKDNLSDRVRGLVGDMERPPFEEKSFDLIWSEGAIDNIGFEHGISIWKKFLKEGGYIAVTCPSFLTEERPEEVRKFWEAAGSHLDSIDENIRMLLKHGYRHIASFTIPDECWTENYFKPREKAIGLLREKYVENEVLKAYVEQNRYEVELFSRYRRYYGYVFYIARTM